MTIRVEIPRYIHLRKKSSRYGRVVKVFKTYVPIPSQPHRRIDYVRVLLDTGRIVHVVFDDCELISY
jgi:hypothetical protein